MWQLISCVNLTGLGYAQIAGKHYFWVCLWGYFWKRLTCDSVDWVEIFTLHNSHVWSGIIQTLEDLNGTKRWRKGKFSLFFKLEHLSLPTIGHWSPWFLGLWTPGLIPVAPFFSNLQIQTELYHQFLVPKLADNRLWDFLASITA